MLYFYNYTVISTRTDRTTLFRLSSLDESADVRNNVFYVTQPGRKPALDPQLAEHRLDTQPGSACIDAGSDHALNA